MPRKPPPKTISRAKVLQLVRCGNALADARERRGRADEIFRTCESPRTKASYETAEALLHSARADWEVACAAILKGGV